MHILLQFLSQIPARILSALALPKIDHGLKYFQSDLQVVFLVYHHKLLNLNMALSYWLKNLQYFI